MTGRLGIYVDDVYRVSETDAGSQISGDRAFLLFASEVGTHFERTVLFGRTLQCSAPADYLLPMNVELAELPYYENLGRLTQVARVTLRTGLDMWRALSRVDSVWVFGPHPFALILTLLALLRRKRVVLGVRQDTTAYFRARLPNSRRAALVLPVYALDIVYRLLARRLRTTVVGAEIARRYGGPRPSLLSMTVSLVRTGDIVAAPARRERRGPVRVLTVGRLEPEKNPLLLVEALAELEREQPGQYHVTWVGRGPLEESVRTRAAELSVTDRLELQGYVPFGPALFGLYRDADVFVHVSLTEGVPQVVLESMAAGTPVVATNVGGVADAVDRGCAGLLVPPRDRDALVTAVRRLAEDSALRERLITRGLELARTRTLELEAERVARFLADGEAGNGSGPRRARRG